MLVTFSRRFAMILLLLGTVSLGGITSRIIEESWAYWWGWGFYRNCNPTSMWLNDGYVDDLQKRQEYSYPQVAAALARKFARFAELSKGDTILDVGFGFGDQDLLFVEEFGVTRIIGYDVKKENVLLAQARVNAIGLQERIHLEVGDALHLTSVFDASVDKILSLQNAFEFDNRDAFFREAWRALKPGGTVNLVDFVAASERLEEMFKKGSKKVDPNGSNFWTNNYYALPTYVNRLKKAGFSNIKVLDITNRTPFLRSTHIAVMPSLVRLALHAFANGSSPYSSVIDTENLLRPQSLASVGYYERGDLINSMRNIMIKASKRGAARAPER